MVETTTGAVVSPKGNWLFRIIQDHYSVVPIIKSRSEIEREKWLLPQCILFNRWYCMPAAFIVQFCCGSLYSWSVFNKPIDLLIFGHITNTAPITFYIAVGFFGFAAAIMGPWLERHGPLRTCALGTCLFFIGNLLTALALYFKQIWLVFLGYGVIGGFGLGVCYISPVSALQKWFPEKRGLAAGFAVCGFGAGSIVVSKIQLPLIHLIGLPLTFVMLGSIYFILMIISAFVFRTPPPNYTLNGSEQVTKIEKVESSNQTELKDTYVTNGIPVTTVEVSPVPENIQGLSNYKYTVNGSESKVSKSEKDEIQTEFKDNDIVTVIPVTTTTTTTTTVEVSPAVVVEIIQPLSEMRLIEALTSTDFRLIMIMFTSNIIFGLVLVSRLSNIITDVFGKSAEVASTVVAVNGGFNLCGRLVVSMTSDFVGRRNCFVIMLSLQVIILGCFSTMTNNLAYWPFVITMWIVTSCYGAAFGVIPAFLSDKFGTGNIGACHGIILTGWSFAGVVGGIIFTTIFDSIVGSVDSSRYKPNDPYPYNVNVWWIFGIVCIGWFAVFFVRPMKQDMKLTGWIKRKIKCCPSKNQKNYEVRT